jgi:hypothetical protein
MSVFIFQLLIEVVAGGCFGTGIVFAEQISAAHRIELDAVEPGGTGRLQGSSQIALPKGERAAGHQISRPAS